MTIFARHVEVTPQPKNRRAVTYLDLVKLPDNRYALMDGLNGRLVEELTEADALAKLQAWED